MPAIGLVREERQGRDYTHDTGGDVEEGGERVSCQDDGVGYFVDPERDDPDRANNEAEGANEGAEACDGRYLVNYLVFT